MGENDSHETESMIALYSTTSAEAVRYRDREWANVGFFTAAIVAVLGYALSLPAVDRTDVALSLEVVICGLAVGGIYYSWFAHLRLAACRVALSRLEAKLKIAGETSRQALDEFWANFRYGLWDHLLPFFMADVALAAFGLAKLPGPIVWEVILGTGSVALLAIALVVSSLSQNPNRRDARRLPLPPK